MTAPFDRLQPFLARLADGATLSEDEAAEAFDIIMSGGATPSQIGAFLMALRLRGETVEEITGAARIMREKATSIAAPADAIDCCGTGGDRSGSFNVSTAVALILAGARVTVAKHGNRAQSSRTGAADVLATLGVNLDADLALVRRALFEARICFLFAQRHHGAMRHVGPTRVELGTRNIFNLLGPLANPAGARRQLLGVYSRDWIVPLAEVLRKLGAERAWVISGSDGMDEITTTGPTWVASLDRRGIETFEVTPEDAGLTRARPEDLKGGDPESNAEALRGLLAGTPGPYRDIAVLNAAAGLIIAGRCQSLREGAAIAAQSIDDGAAARALERLVAITNTPMEQEDP